MLAKQIQPLISEEDYLDMERDSKIRHEYIEGHIYAIAGGSRSHNKSASIARYLNTSESTIQKWETGAKRPSGMALKLLAVVQKHELKILT